MKPILKLFFMFYVIISSYSTINALADKSKTKGSKCAVSTISIPKGSNLPVVVFRASLGEEAFDLTVVEKDHLAKYKVNGNLVFKDENKGESWYSGKKYYESMGDAFSLCKSIHEENVKQNLYEQKESTGKNNILMKYRISELPCYITPLDQDKEKSQSEKTDSNDKTENVSFIQTKVKKKNFLKNSNKMDEKMELNMDSFIRLNEMFKPNDMHF